MDARSSQLRAVFKVPVVNCDEDEQSSIMTYSSDLSDSRLLLNSCRISSSSLLLLLQLLDGFRLMALKLPAWSLAFLVIQCMNELINNNYNLVKPTSDLGS
jgi:hypothetical protein